jgi:hypothetical protein
MNDQIGSSQCRNCFGPQDAVGSQVLARQK